TRSQLPALLRPCTDVAPYSGDGSLHELAARAAFQPVTCLAGNTARLTRLADLVRQQTGRATLREAWPMLQAVLYSRGPADPSREQLAGLIGDPRILAMEACVRPEGVVAVEDPRHGLLRVVPDH